MTSLDALDRRLLGVLLEEPRLGVLGTARRLGVARGTVQARLERMERTGVLAGWEPRLDPTAMGFGVEAFVTLEIRQLEGRDALTTHLAAIPQVLEVHTITGQGDLLCRVVARSNADLQEVIDRVVSSPDVARTSTVIALGTPVPYRVRSLLTAPAESP